MWAVGQAAACVEGQPVKWFKHDADANQDAKLRRVRLKYGMEGYGLYWYCLELVARGVEKHRLSFELEHDSELIAADTGIHRERVEEMMRYMVELRLFERAEGVITCLKMASRTDEYTQALLKKTGTAVSVLPGLSRECPESLPRVSRESRDTNGRKSVLIEENRKEEINNTGRRFTPPTPTEVSEYAASAGITIAADRFCNFYASKGWKVGKTPMKDWKAAVRNWGSSPTTQIVELAHPSQRGVIL